MLVILTGCPVTTPLEACLGEEFKAEVYFAMLRGWGLARQTK